MSQITIQELFPLYTTACKWGTFFKSTIFSEKVRLIKEYNVKPLCVIPRPVSIHLPSFTSQIKWCRLTENYKSGFIYSNHYDWTTMNRIIYVDHKSVFVSNITNQPIDMSVLKTPSDKMYVRGFSNS